VLELRLAPQGRILAVAEQTDRTGTPLFDEWVDEAGEEAVVASVRAAKAAIED
jgi:hypothetical protein